MIRGLSKWQRAIGLLFVISLLGAVAVRLFGALHLVLPVAAPALIITGWISAGHLITIDDDFPGGFSNPDGDPAVVRSSLIELSIKFSVFAATAAAVLALHLL